MLFGRNRRKPKTPEPYWPACEQWQQGDYSHSPNLIPYVLNHNWKPKRVVPALGAVIVSQTCDVVRGEDRPHIQLAAIVAITDKGEHHLAVDGHQPRYHHLPASGPNHFIDLDTITTVHKSALNGITLHRGARNDDEVRNLSAAVGRKFGRFAYPDKVNEALDPIVKAIKEKALRPNSPLGKAVANVHSFRLGCEDWNRTPRDLTLHVILHAGVTPTFDDVSPHPPKPLTNRIKSLGKNPTPETRSTALLKYLDQKGLTGDDLYWAWQYLAECWADQCNNETVAQKITHEVRDVTAEVSAVNEYTLAQHDETHALDLDYLSDSRSRP